MSRIWMSMACVPLSICITACVPATLSQQYGGVSAVPVDKAYLCARAFADSSGYTLISSDRPSGVFRASHAGDAFIEDQIAVSILPRPDGQTQMYVTAESYRISTDASRNNPPEMVAPTSSVKAVADLVLYRCVRSYHPFPPADSAHS
jgi:hypothetical protein